jgi:phosphatidylinositol dimannoside acyltransferase
MQRVTGSTDTEVIERATAAVFANYARYWYEMFRLGPRSGAELQASFGVRGGEHLDAALAEGRGVILALPHLGNWDVAGAWLAGRGVPVTVVAETVEPAELFQWFAAARQAVGMEVVALGDGAVPALVRALRDGHGVCLLADRDLTGDGIEVDLFGERTRLPGGPAVLAFRTGAPLLPVGTYAVDGRHCAWFDAPLDVERRGRLRDDVEHVTQELAHRFERFIRAAPEQWLMMQPNWPSDVREAARSSAAAPAR